jgi:hypothetical protein
VRGMNCEDFQNGLIELARDVAPAASRSHGASRDELDNEFALDHIRSCAACHAFFEAQLALTAAAARLRAASPAEPPAYLEPLLLSRFLAARRPSRPRWRRATAATAMGAAAAIAAAVFVWFPSVRPASRPRPPAPLAVSAPRSQPPVAAVRPGDSSSAEAGIAIASPRRALVRTAAVPPRPPQPRGDAAPFVAIPYTLPLDPREPAAIVRMEMPVTALAAVGLAVAVPDPAARAQADVLVGEDGRIRAIRLVSLSDPLFTGSQFHQEMK